MWPHARATTRGPAVSKDANDNTIFYGPRQLARRSICYDGENRPVSFTTNGNTTSFGYGSDNERAGKSSLACPRFCRGCDAEVPVAAKE